MFVDEDVDIISNVEPGGNMVKLSEWVTRWDGWMNLNIYNVHMFTHYHSWPTPQTLDYLEF